MTHTTKRGHARRRAAMLWVFTLVGAHALSSAPAEACTVPAMTPKARVAAADLVIYGEVVAVRSLEDQDSPPSGVRPALKPFEAKVRIRRVYKGKTSPALRVRGHTATATCGVGQLRLGQRVGLLLDRPGPPFSVGLANRISARELREATGGRFHRPGTANPVRCPHGADAALRLGAASGQAGDAIQATVVNCGTTSLGSGLQLQWEARQADGTFAPVQPPGPPTLELHAVRAGETRRFTGHVWANLQPGEYRAALRATAGERAVVLYAGPFQVLS